MVFHKFIEKYLLVFYRIYGDSGKKEARSGGGETTPATGTERHPAVVVRFCIAGRGLVHTGIRRLLFHLLEQRPGCRQVRAGVRCDAGSGEQLGWQVGCGNGELYRRRMVRPLRDLHPDRADRPFSADYALPSDAAAQVGAAYAGADDSRVARARLYFRRCMGRFRNRARWCARDLCRPMA